MIYKSDDTHETETKQRYDTYTRSIRVSFRLTQIYK